MKAIDRLRQLATATAETVEGLRQLVTYSAKVLDGLSQIPRVMGNLDEFSSMLATLSNEHELEQERDTLLDHNAMLDTLNTGMAVELHEVKAERDTLRDQLDWLKRWRKQSEEPCPFPGGTWVEWRSECDPAAEVFGIDCGELRGISRALWRPTVECLGFYMQKEKSDG